MIRVTRIVVVGALSAGLALGSLEAQQPSATFRSTAAAVVVAARVTDGVRPVPGLSAKDFELLDNGVAQDIALAAVEALPVDVSLVLDTSGSLTGPALDALKQGVQDIARGLRTSDRVRLVTFAADVTSVFAFQPGGGPLRVDAIESGGGTSFYNALAAALMTGQASERPQLIFGFSDGLDTLSFLDANDVVSLAGHSAASLYLAILRGIGMGSPRNSPWTGGPNFDRLRDAVARAGGALYVRAADAPLGGLFREVLEDFRTSYVLSYVPRGVSRAGWHEVVVRTKNGRHTVRARKGYEGG